MTKNSPGISGFSNQSKKGKQQKQGEKPLPPTCSQQHRPRRETASHSKSHYDTLRKKKKRGLPQLQQRQSGRFEVHSLVKEDDRFGRHSHLCQDSLHVEHEPARPGNHHLGWNGMEWNGRMIGLCNETKRE